MTSQIQIKVARANQLTEIQKIAAATWPSTYGNIISAAQITYMLAEMYNNNQLQKQLDNNTTFLLADLGNKFVGFAAFGYVDTYWEYKLQKLYVLPEMQGKGVGKHLLTHIQNQLRSINITKMSLQVNRNNVAVQFYEKLGFTVVNSKDFHFGNNYYMNDYIMQCTF